MSLWTPGGEHPVDRGTGGSGAAQAAAAGPPPSAPAAGGAAAGGQQQLSPDQQQLSPDQQAEAEAMAAEMAQVREQLASVPAAVVVANHAMGLYELAAIHLSQVPANVAEARVAIDGFAALLDGLKGRLGPDEAVLVDALNQLRLAFVEVSSAGAPATGGDGGTAGPEPDAPFEAPPTT